MKTNCLKKLSYLWFFLTSSKYKRELNNRMAFKMNKKFEYSNSMFQAYWFFKKYLKVCWGSSLFFSPAPSFRLRLPLKKARLPAPGIWDILYIQIFCIPITFNNPCFSNKKYPITYCTLLIENNTYLLVQLYCATRYKG